MAATSEAGGSEMKIGLQIPDFTWPGGPATLGADLGRVARTADDAGFDAVAVMDHVFQIGPVGPIENDMLEGYTTLGFLAAHTSRARLLTLVTGVTYRDPGLLAKIVTTLDVLSGRPGLARCRRRLERRGEPWARAVLPADGRAVRAAGGDAADLPADVERRRLGVRRHALPARAAAELAAEPEPAASADHDRWRRREEDAAAGRSVRPGLQPVPRPGAPAQAGGAPGALRARGPRLRRDRKDRDLPVRRRLRRCGREAGRAAGRSGRARHPDRHRGSGRRLAAHAAGDHRTGRDSRRRRPVGPPVADFDSLDPATGAVVARFRVR